MQLLHKNEAVMAPDAPVRVMSVHARERLWVKGPGTVFGYAAGGSLWVEEREVKAGDFFCVAIAAGADCAFRVPSRALLIEHAGYRGHRFMQGRVEIERGHVRYIDGCTDSLLVCPPRAGEPCLNALYFPPGVEQTFHTHPSLRAGVVVAGAGVACCGDGEIPLHSGDVFYLPTLERHRFRTGASSMVVLAFHPDSDWGPTDEAHPMINRTIISEELVS